MSRLRLMTWNLLHGGRGEDGQRLDLISTVLRAARPDVLVACEGHGLLEEPRVLGDLAAAVGMKARAAPSADGDHVLLLTKPSIAIPHFEAATLPSGRAAALAVVRAPGMSDVLLAGCHLDARSSDLRLLDVQSLLQRFPPGWPRVLMGDLNQISHEDGLTRRDLLALPLHHVERHVAPDGEPDVRLTRELVAAGMVDAWRLAHQGEPWSRGATVPTALPRPPRFGTLRLDYIWLSSDVPAALTSCETWRDAPAPAASDHYAVVADLEPHGAA